VRPTSSIPASIKESVSSELIAWYRTEALVEDIRTDVRVALNSLARGGYAGYASDPFLLGGEGEGEEEGEKGG